MKLRKTMAGVLACAMLATLAGCGSGGTSSAASTASTASGASGSAEGASYRVGVCQLMQHPALDSATQGFQDALTETFGDAVTFDVENASGDNSNCATIINSFVSSDVDLILANATTPLQAAAAATDSIPILGTSITDYATALDVTDWTGSSGRNISGTTDLAPLDGQADMIKELFPDAKNVGLLYCSAEPNSKYQVNVITEYLTELGYTCTEYSFSDTNDLSAVCTSACAASDVIYIPTDNTAANNTELIANIAVPAGVPIVAGEQGICSGCGVATLSIDYYELGRTTGEMAAKILTGEADITTMEVQSAPTFTKMYNPTLCEQLGVTIPEGYTAIEAE
ncbi:ABC transporter substrate-binding protein [Allofournierella massiliensis]|uniref:Putative ABC transport system substrate-binding protein n=1 Tax=Allofournierella massiliensis TaxID=1650663 RepID=A0A4V2QCT0_9FIRM|nr:ABC transporter substrate-binding protein [Fournierella massiliensis]TCL61567.1 putative ABC transport system substrate-binding protein [Fournierella massiliensis]